MTAMRTQTLACGGASPRRGHAPSMSIFQATKAACMKNESGGFTFSQTTARAGGAWFTTATPPQTSSEKLAKSRLTDRPTVRRSDHGPWYVSMDRDFPYPASDTNYGRPAGTVIRCTVHRSDRTTPRDQPKGPRGGPNLGQASCLGSLKNANGGSMSASRTSSTTGQIFGPHRGLYYLTINL
uniref:Uncharacterized protein n=1 Tax=Solanum tuberosum TaxID=4113 RepID=M1DYV2_SOLTU